MIAMDPDVDSVLYRKVDTCDENLNWEFIFRSPYTDVEIPVVSLADYVWKDVDKFTDNVALVITVPLSHFPAISSVLNFLTCGLLKTSQNGPLQHSA